ncbi:MAG TPA: shikimate kinase [Opitutaceae bacterium]|jgi:shikimate kinase|nr:shikimate kinase [Opitutaceae bacterium]
MSEFEPNLYLVGFMGTGKTTIGRALGQRLGFAVIDSDHEIERVCGKPVTEIFAQEGEAEFRRQERRFVESGHPASRHIVACGGGLIVPEGMLELLKSKGVVICLHASIETILKRTQGQRHRPLLNVDDLDARVRDLYAAREPIYRKAGTMILTDARPLNDIVTHVMRSYRREAGDWLRQHRMNPRLADPRV